MNFEVMKEVILWVVKVVWVARAWVIALRVSGKAAKTVLCFIFLCSNDCMNLKYVFTVITFLCVDNLTHPLVSDIWMKV